MSFLTVFFQSSEILILYLEEHVSDKNSKILLRNLTSTKSYLIMWNSWWWSQVRLWPRGDHHGPHPDPGWVPTPPLSAAQLPLGWGFWGLGSRDSTHLNLKGPKPQGSCSSNLRPGSTPEGNENHWAAGKHRFKPGLTPAPPSAAPPPIKLKIVSTPWGKTQLLFTSSQQSRQSHRVHADYNGTLPLKDISPRPSTITNNYHR